MSQGVGQRRSISVRASARRKVMHRGDLYTMLVWVALLCIVIPWLQVEAADQSLAPLLSPPLLWIVTEKPPKRGKAR